MHHRRVTNARLTALELQFLTASRRAVLVTVDPDGLPRPVPICHVVKDGASPVLYTPIDEKPKSSGGPAALARVRDIVVRPEVVVMVDRWDEDWAMLGWLRVHGHAELREPGPATDADFARVVPALRAKYPQYRDHALEERPLIRIALGRARSWGRLEGPS